MTKENTAKVDLLRGSSMGQVLLANNMDTNALRTNRLLRKDEWKAIDRAVTGQYLSRLRLVKLLKSRGLTYDYGDGLASTVLQWEEEVTDGGAAQMSMDGLDRERSQRPDYTLKSLPLPITHDGFQVNARLLAESRKLGRPIDTVVAGRKARNVAEKVEDVFLNGTSNFKYGTQEIYGILNHPDRNTKAISGKWDDSAKSGKDMAEDIISMKQTLIDLNHFGPYYVLLPKNYETVLDEDYNDNYVRTIRTRLAEIGNVDGYMVIDDLPDDQMVMLELKTDTVEVVSGLPVRTVEWEEQGGMVNFYRIMTIEVPRVRSDADGNSGIVHATLS